ncbi:hypothetical protein DEJ50_20830 [Streptomyces venezuelae]|uniref:Uncharacterized protein n=1 Tax=Streptomyces venezuelae TaxID=54571 RepID=A0A5P2D414_STRVZ|nr:hypothetical protein [Streptomyces venezuelae]QES49902.1 hypothetical protein DEJ50_20830 [Streptomyces venezuelae]
MDRDRDRGDEPVFIRSKWGTNRYVYNPNNPVGRALIVIAVIVFIVFMVLIQTRSGPFAVPEDKGWQPQPPATEPWPQAS